MATAHCKLVFLLLAAALSFTSARAQDMIGVGGSGIYNITNKGIGFSARLHIPVRERVAVVPQLTWFPKFNPVSRFYGSVGANFNFLMRDRFTAYVCGSGSLSVSASASANASGTANGTGSSGEASASKSGKLSASGDAGLGLLFGRGCWRPFTEGRYDPLTGEITAHLGILWFPQCSGSRSAGRSKGRKEPLRSPSRVRCPAYQ